MMHWSDWSYRLEPRWCMAHTTSLSYDSIARRFHDDVIKWKPFPRYWPFVWGIHHRSLVVVPFTNASDAELWCFLWSVPEQTVANNRDADDLRCHRAHYDVTVMHWSYTPPYLSWIWKRIHSSHNEIRISGMIWMYFYNENISIKWKVFVLCYNLKASISLCWLSQSYKYYSA